MGLDELVDDHEQEHEEEETRNLLDELGIESREELEAMDGRIGSLSEMVISLDSRVERLNDRLERQEKLLSNLIEEVVEKEPQEENDESSFEW